ncbi:MAG TPA: hypothetical protein VNW71_07200 [Thermoanaerobaculia bacterium]|nr:hypothetical protein [Thermoanaerobaculia bacterium]
MNPRNLRLTALSLAALVLMIAATADARPRRDRGDRHWEVLGTLGVSDARDRDLLGVTARKGSFRSVKLEVLGQAVQFRSMKIHFANGETQHVALRDVIPAGGESRVIDIEGAGDRVIRAIEFRYDAQSLLGKRARVRVYGKN